ADFVSGAELEARAVRLGRSATGRPITLSLHDGSWIMSATRRAATVSRARTAHQQWVEELRDVGRKVVLAVARLLALLLFMGMHWLLCKAGHAVLSEGWSRAGSVLDAIFVIGFGLVYIDQVIEMVGVFVPRLQDWRRRAVQGDNHRRGGSDDC